MSVPSASRSVSSTSLKGATSRGVLIWLGAVIGLLALNWVAAIARFQVNGLYWDQWGFCSPLFAEKGWTSLFTVQHGPHRQGLAFVFTSWIMGWSDWDNRFDSLWITGQLVGAAVLALRLRWRLVGRLRWTDTWIPVATLALSQYENVILVPNGSHSIFPLLMLLIAANLWMGGGEVRRWGGLGLIAFCEIFTGFGLFAGLMLTALFGVAVGRAIWTKRRPEIWGAGLALVVAVGGWAWFSHGYVFAPASEGYYFPHDPLFDYVRFVALMPAGRMGFGAESTLAYLLGGLMLGATLVVGGWTGFRLLRPEVAKRDEVMVLLLGTGLAFAAFTAVGRVHLGVTGGMVSRYGPLLLPLWLGLQIAVDRWGHRSAQLGFGVLGWMMAFGPWIDGVSRPMADWPGTIGLSDTSKDGMWTLQLRKMQWLYAFDETGDWREAERRVPAGMHPNVEGGDFAHLIPWLVDRHLSFAAKTERKHGWMPWWLGSETWWIRSAYPGPEQHWIAEEGELAINPGEAGFINLQVVGAGQQLPATALIEVEIDGRVARAPVSVWWQGLSFRVDKSGHRVVVRCLGGAQELDPPTDTRVASVEIVTPQREPVARFPLWVWAESTQDFGVERAISIESGRYDWEGEGEARFSWTGAKLDVAVTARSAAWLNVDIGGRFAAVDHGSVVVSLDERRWEIDLVDGKRSFAVSVPADGRVHRLRVENLAGARSPREEGISDDDRELALSLRRLSIDATAAFKVLP